MPALLPVSSQSGLPIDPMTLQALQEQQMGQMVNSQGGAAAWRMNNAAAQQALGSLFPSPQMQLANQAQGALKSATLTPNPGENPLDFQIRQTAAYMHAVAPYSPQSALSLGDKLAQLSNMKEEQQHLVASDQRQQSIATSQEALNSVRTGVLGDQLSQENAVLAAGIPGIVATDLGGQNPLFHSFDLSTDNGRQQYRTALTQGGVPLSQAQMAQVAGQHQREMAYLSMNTAAGLLTPTAMEQIYQVYKTTGKMPNLGMYRLPGQTAQIWNYVAQRAASEGLSGQAAVANGQATAAAGAVYKDFTSGPDSRTIGAINTAVNHANAALTLIPMLGNTNIPALNAARLAFQQQTGVAAPGNFAELRNMLVGEIGKTISALGGSEQERVQIIKPLATANSPQQLTGAISTAERILAGKTDALRVKYHAGTLGRYQPFNNLLAPATLHALGTNVQQGGPGGVSGAPVNPSPQSTAAPPAAAAPAIPSGWSVSVVGQ